MYFESVTEESSPCRNESQSYVGSEMHSPWGTEGKSSMQFF